MSRPVFVLAAAFIAVACSVSPPDPQQSNFFACATNDDCLDGYLCVGSRCVASGPQCTDHDDCPQALFCRDGKCVENPCEDASCPSGTVCVSSRNAANGFACTLQAKTGCGNGIRESGEECDDGNETNGDGCSADCRIEPPVTCGNEDTDPGEQCDDGGESPECDDDCTMVKCGDGNVNQAAGERCDDGGQNGSGEGACVADCSAVQRCGDGTTQGTELCDDGNLNGQPEQCNTSCTAMTPVTCGNSTREGGEECDDGANGDDCDGCLDDCTAHVNTCGDARKCGGEACDDGNLQDGDGCDSNCQFEIPEFCTSDPLDCSDPRCFGPACPEVCSKTGEDEDGDGNADCLDEDCFGPGCSEICDGLGRDEDGDENADCLDEDCFGPSCSEICDGLGRDEDADGNADCLDEDCFGPSCSEICDSQGRDEDADGNADCLDEDCFGPNCSEICDGQGRDEDGDGNADCLDEDCFGAGCSEICGVDGQDEDGDGDADCLDQDCFGPSCSEICNGLGRDEDGDGVSDCDDSDCSSSGCQVVQVAAGGDHTCALLDSGAVRCWGKNDYGQLGYGNALEVGDNEAPASAGDVPVGGTATQIVAGRNHTCALLDGGVVRCWGVNSNGRLGYGNTEHIGDDETPQVAGDVDIGGIVSQLAAGQNHTCALLTTGTVRCWGENWSGKLGYGHTADIGDDETPSWAGDVQVGDTVTQIAAGAVHTCAVLASGTARCWGDGYQGSLGYGNTQSIGDDETPASAGDVHILGTVAQIATGRDHTCALLTTGAVHCWGEGSYGETGYAHWDVVIGDDEAPSSVGAVPIDAAVAHVAAGWDHTCVILQTGSMRCWGRGDHGRLGYGHTAWLGDDETPRTFGDVDTGGTVTQMALGRDHTCVVLDNGTVRCWGLGDNGRLGYGNVLTLGDALNEVPTKDVPVVSMAYELCDNLRDDDNDNHVDCEDTDCHGFGCAEICDAAGFDEDGDGAADCADEDCHIIMQPDIVVCSEVCSGGFDEDADGNTDCDDADCAMDPVCDASVTVTQVAAGGDHTCALLDTGAVRCWGQNDYGQLGYGDTNYIGDNETPASAGDVPVGGVVTQIVAGSYHTCALLDGGAVRCWGGYGSHLGYGNGKYIGDDETPASAGDVPIGGSVTQLAAGEYHTCALLATGNVRCWGYGDGGKLGYGNTITIGDDETPSWAGDVTVGGTVTQIAAGGVHTCALLAAGNVRCWGYGYEGSLGYGNPDDIGDDETPASAGNVPVGGTVAQIAAGRNHTCALLTTGAVHCWGEGSYGEIGYAYWDYVVGDDETPSSLGAVPIGAAATKVAAGWDHTCVLLQTGGMRCWGRGEHGRLGYGHRTWLGDDETPSTYGDVDVGATVTQIALGQHHTCVATSTGKARCWGLGDGGRLGYGSVLTLGDEVNEVPARDVPVVSTAFELCGNWFDDDGDTLVDCEDSDCHGFGCAEICDPAGFDEDGDGAADCADEDCHIIMQPNIVVCSEVCSGGFDEDADGATDCDDADCVSDPACDAAVDVTQVAAGGGHTCALLGTGAVRCWGQGDYGQLGYGNINDIGDNEVPASAGDVPVGGRVTQVVAGLESTCALLDTGSVRCWGAGWGGKLGYGTSDCIGDDETPASAGDVPIGGSVTQLAAGEHHTCALLSTGDVRCWGSGGGGQLGYGNTITIGDDETPLWAGDVTVGGTVTQIAAGGMHTCALLAAGTVRCWGYGYEGSLGYGNPDDIGDDETPASAGNVPVGGTVAQIAAGRNHTCALLTTGAAYCWGESSYGEIGYGNYYYVVGDDETPSSVGAVPIGTAASEIATGWDHTCVLLQTGGMRCWGRADYGQLGYGNTTYLGDDETPSTYGDVTTGGTVTQMALGQDHTCVTLSTGKARCWGLGDRGRLGYGNTVTLGDSAGEMPPVDIIVF